MCVCVCVCTWMHACVRACVRACMHECMCVCISKIVNRKIPYNTQWQIFPQEFPQLRLSELIEYSVGLPAATSKGNTRSQNTCLSATLPRCARELTANLVFCSWATLFSCKCRPANLIFNWSSVHLNWGNSL